MLNEDHLINCLKAYILLVTKYLFSFWLNTLGKVTRIGSSNSALLFDVKVEKLDVKT